MHIYIYTSIYEYLQMYVHPCIIGLMKLHTDTWHTQRVLFRFAFNLERLQHRSQAQLPETALQHAQALLAYQLPWILCLGPSLYQAGNICRMKIPMSSSSYYGQSVSPRRTSIDAHSQSKTLPCGHGRLSILMTDCQDPASDPCKEENWLALPSHDSHPVTDR